MWIKKLYATFGALDNKTLSLKEGLNIVYGHNEAGKSTWSAFIRAMFYGISTREKARVGYLPDKEKYLPWNGNPMYGRMLVSRRGDEIEIERSSGKTGVFSKVVAKNISRGEVAPTGEELLGVSRSVYERSAFIGQAKIALSGDADIEKKILSLASSGDETVSALEVRERLLQKQRIIRSPRGNGLLPSLEKEREEIERALQNAGETEAELKELSESIEENKKLFAKLSRDLKIALSEEDKKKREYILRARETLAEKEKKAKGFEAYPDRGDYDAFAMQRLQWQELSLSLSKAEAELSSQKQAEELSEAELSAHPAFVGLDEARAAEVAEEDKNSLGIFPKKKLICTGIALFALAAVLAIIFTISNILPCAFAAVASAVSGAVALIFSNRGKKELFKKICQRYGSADKDAIEKALSEYVQALYCFEKAKNAVRESEISVRQFESARKMREDDLRLILSRFGITSEDIASGEKLFRSLVEEREISLRELADARIRVEAIAEAADEASETVEYEQCEIPNLTSTEIKEKIASCELLGKNHELRAAALRERLSGFDRAEEEKKLSDIEAGISEHTREYEAYSLAMKTIAESDEELRGRFSPEVEKKTAEIFSFLTGGSFEVVSIKNSDFEMEVATGIARDRKDTLSLSQGTLDELYFALRLALCELVLPEEDALPMVLDDVFVNFDDERTKRALELLSGMAKKRQIILFSCHTREARFFEDSDTVNKIEL